MSAILKYDFQKEKTITFYKKKNYINYRKIHYFACDIYTFPKTRANKN